MNLVYSSFFQQYLPTSGTKTKLFSHCFSKPVAVLSQTVSLIGISFFVAGLYEEKICMSRDYRQKMLAD
jgi:hypothetical protein